MLTDRSKTYQTVMLLGAVTDTQDTTGTILNENRGMAETLDEEKIRNIAEGFMGPYSQIPPMYSALKVNGKKLYELAREGKEIERKARPVEIFSLTVDRIELPRVTMTVHCSKGTYIRTLCHDIGEKLGCGGCMEYLLRTQVDRFLLKDSLKLSEVEALVREGRIEDAVIPVDQMFSGLLEIVSESGTLDRLLANGNFFAENQAGRGSAVSGAEDGSLCRVYDSRRRFIGVYEYRAREKRWKPKKIFLGGE